MKTIIFLLLKTLNVIIQVFVDFCESFMSHFSLIRWAFNNDPNTSNLEGIVGRWIFYKSKGRSLIRGLPSHFEIKDPSAWQGRWSKFSAFFNFARSMKYNLSSLYEDEDSGRYWFHTLCSQLSHFWVRQIDGTFLFSPGLATVSIGNGSMPDTRNVVFSSPAINTLKISFDNTIGFPDLENNDDTLQLMLLNENGTFSFWTDLTSVTRSSGSATYVISEQFGPKIYPSVKFKAGVQYDGKIKGIFRFPQSMQPVTILR